MPLTLSWMPSGPVQPFHLVLAAVILPILAPGLPVPTVALPGAVADAQVSVWLAVTSWKVTCGLEPVVLPVNFTTVPFAALPAFNVHVAAAFAGIMPTITAPAAAPAATSVLNL